MSLDTGKAVAKLRGLTKKFDTAVAASTPFYPQLCTETFSDGANEECGILGGMPGIREWVGDRAFKQLRAARFTIDNKVWESSVAIDKDDINDDRLGMYGPVLSDLGAEAMYHPDELLFALMVAGKSAPCMDGQYFYDTDHTWGDSGTQDNDLTATAATGTTPTAAEFRTAFHAARRKLASYKNDQGKLLNRPTVKGYSHLMVIVNPDLEVIANEALVAPVNASGATNIVLNPPVIVASEFVTDATEMYLHNLEGSVKSFVFQKREALTREMKGSDDLEFKDVKFMTKARYNVGYLAWWKTVLTTFT